MYDIIFIAENESIDQEGYQLLKKRFPLLKRASTFSQASERSFTKIFWLIYPYVRILDSFNFDTIMPEWDEEYVYTFKNGEFSDGVFLMSKNLHISDREIVNRFFVHTKHIDEQASAPLPYDVFYIDTYEEYQYALANSKTEMFWMTTYNITPVMKYDLYFNSHYDRTHNHAFIHQVDGIDYYNGIFLCSKAVPLSKKEVEYRHPVDRKEWDIIGSTKGKYDVFYIDTYEEYQYALANSKTEMFWMTTYNITPVMQYDLYFNNHYDRTHNHAFIHQVDGIDYYNGIFLCSKAVPLSKKEVEYRHPVDRKEWDIIGSTKGKYDVFYIDTYEEYQYALSNSKTEMFWMTTYNITPVMQYDLYFSNYNMYDRTHIYDRTHNHAFIHQVDGIDYHNGIFLCSKAAPLSKKEVEYRHPVDRKEWDIIGSTKGKYDVFYIDTYEEYQYALSNSKTEMFWIVPPYVTILDTFNFELYFPHNDQYNRNINHVMKNGAYHDGIVLAAKTAIISKKEFDHGFIVDKKEWDIAASIPILFDIVYISYFEKFADDNFETLKTKIGNQQLFRVDGVTGIHQAHIEAAKMVTTSMFWVVDADAIILDTFKFNYQVEKHNQDMVHVWRSSNPINNLVYGHGGVKLLPTELTLAVDVTSTDMTTSISSKFKSIHEESNITAFNTDPFSTWKSAFRECVKLSSGIINGSNSEETSDRLDIWCTTDNGAIYGIYAMRGAIAGRKYGKDNVGNIQALSKINDFSWLKDQFDIKNN